MNNSTAFRLIIAVGLVLSLTAFGQYSIERSSFSPGTPKSGGTYEIKEAAAGQSVTRTTFHEAGADSIYLWQGFVQINNIPVVFSASAIDSYPNPSIWNYVPLSTTNPSRMRFRSYSNLSGGAWRTSTKPIYNTGLGSTDTIWLDEYSEWEYNLDSDASETPGYEDTRWRAKSEDIDFTGTVDYSDWLASKHQDYFQQYRADVDVIYSPSGSHTGIVNLVRWYKFGNDVSATAPGINLNELNDWTGGIPGPQWADAGSDLEFPEHTVDGAEDWFTVNVREWESLDKNIDKIIVYGQPINANLEATMLAWRGYSLIGVPLYPVEDTVTYRLRYNDRYGEDPPFWPPTTRADQDVVLYDDFHQYCEVPDLGWPGKYRSWWQISKFRGDAGSYAIYNGPSANPPVAPFWPGNGYWLVQDHCDEVEIDVIGIKPNKNGWMDIPLTKWDGDPMKSSMFYNMCANPFYKDVVGGDVFNILWHDAHVVRFSGGVEVEDRTLASAVSANWVDGTVQLWDGSGYFPVASVLGGPNYGRSFQNWEGFWFQTKSGVPAGDSLALRMKTTEGPSRRVRPEPEPELIASWSAKIGIFSEEAGQWDAHNVFGFKEYADESQAANRMFIKKLPDFCYPAPVIKMFFVDDSDNRYCEYFEGVRRSNTIYNAVLDCESVKNQKVAVRWEIQSLPEGFTMFIEDPDHGMFVDMTAKSEYTFISTGDIHKIRIHVGAPLEWVAKEAEEARDLPREFFLAGPTPNPFNSASRIDFGIPETEVGPVRIEVYDITGRKIRTLMDSDLEAGFYNVIWRGDDNSGAEVASGNYFVRFVSRHREENRRVSLIK